MSREKRMTGTIAIWLFFRALRWACWIGFVGFSVYAGINRETIVDQFGHLPYWEELFMIGIGVVAICMGFLELMARDWTGLQRPKFGELIPPPMRPATHPTGQIAKAMLSR